MADVKKKSNIRWTPEMKFKLAFYASKHKAYIKSTESMADKWKKVLESLTKDSEFDNENFKSSPPATDTLSITFKRHKDEVLKELGISEEGANLSGYEGEPSSFQLLMINMEEEIQKNAFKIKAATLKEKTKQDAIFTHENDLLKNQMNISNSSFNAQDDFEKSQSISDDEEIDGPSGITSSVPSAKKTPKTPTSNVTVTTTNSASIKKENKWTGGFGGSFMNSLVDLTKDDPAIIAEEIEEKKQKRKHDQDRHEFEMAKAQKLLDMEERRLELEERRMKLEEAKHAMLMHAFTKKD
jgi:hypothetical protein